jgi:hypothetical protein
MDIPMGPSKRIGIAQSLISITDAFFKELMYA